MIANAALQQLIDRLSPKYGAGEAQSMARIIFEDVFKIYHSNRQKELSVQNFNQLAEIELRLLKDEPLQYILGEADFYGLKFKVTPDVLIPRPETEELVHWVYSDSVGTSRSVLDIGTGSGCIPITLKNKNKALEITAIDISTAAIDVAKENADRNKVDIQFLESDILDEQHWPRLPKFDIIVSNPPYIPRSETKLMPGNVVRFEPDLALFVNHPDGLLFYRKIADFTVLHLKKQGRLYFEVNEFAAQAVKIMLAEKGFLDVEIREDMQGK